MRYALRPSRFRASLTRRVALTGLEIGPFPGRTGDHEAPDPALPKRREVVAMGSEVDFPGLIERGYEGRKNSGECHTDRDGIRPDQAG